MTMYPQPGLLKRLMRSALLLFLCLEAACSFDYDMVTGDAINEPDIVMKTVDYVRMSDANPMVHFEAEEGRRYEEKHLMELDKFSFEQYNAAPPYTGQENPETPEVNVWGNGGLVRVQTDTGNLDISGGVAIKVASEDVAITTQSAAWRNKERMLTAPGEVDITRSNGTRLSGTGLSADIRRRSWQFDSSVFGDIVDEEAENVENEEGEIEQEDLINSAGE